MLPSDRVGRQISSLFVRSVDMAPTAHFSLKSCSCWRLFPETGTRITFVFPKKDFPLSGLGIGVRYKVGPRLKRGIEVFGREWIFDNSTDRDRGEVLGALI